MVKIGWMQDTHLSYDNNKGNPTDTASNVDSLMTSLGCADWWLTGDAIHPNPPENKIPHVPNLEAAYDNLLNVVSDHYDSLEAILPSHHDAPYQLAVEQDEKIKTWHTKTYDGDGVTTILLDTGGPAHVTGSGGGGGSTRGGGSGTDNGYVPMRTAYRLREELEAAESRGDAKIILPHHLLYPIDNTNLVGSSPSNKMLHNNTAYWVVQNSQFVHDMLSNYSKVVVPQSHLYQFNGEGSYTVDGVTYCYKKHYVNVGTGETYTYGYIDATSSGVDVVTVDQAGATNTIASVTF